MSTKGLAAYGVLAQRFAHSFAPSDPVIVFDQGGIAEALADCVARRLNAERFFVRAILPHDAAVRTDAVLPGILGAFATTDERRLALDQAFLGTLKVNQGMLREIQVHSPGVLRLMQAALRLATGLIVSSEAERRHVEALLDTQLPSAIWDLCDPSVPSPSTTPQTRDSVVIWAPHLTGDAASAFSLALADLRLPVLLIAGNAPSDPQIAQWVPPEHARAALERAKAIVDSSSHGCDAARPLAAWGVPLVADAGSGAQERFENVRCYDRNRMSSIPDAVSAALGSAPPRERSLPKCEYPTIDLLEHGPLVSVVIPTLDRPKLLEFALESIRRQSYDNVETIVVVDGGPRLDQLAVRYPDVRFIYMPKNDPLHSSNTAFAQTRGKYVAFLNDDDIYFPHHIATLVTALERSGCAVAHGDVLTAFLQGDDDEWLVYGFESNMSRAVELSSIMVSNQIGMTSCMFRRDCIEDDAPFWEEVPLYRDYALWVRLASQYDFLHVERLTSCYTIRNGGTTQQSTMWYEGALASYEVIYRKYPAHGRPLIEARRSQILESVKRSEMGIAGAEPAGTISPAPWPPWRVQSTLA